MVYKNALFIWKILPGQKLYKVMVTWSLKELYKLGNLVTQKWDLKQLR